MSDKDNEPGVSRRNFLKSTGLAGAAGVGLASGVLPYKVWAASDGDGLKVHVGPGELDEYYGFWSGGQSGEVRVLGVPSMRELMRIPVFNYCGATGHGLTNESKRILGDNAPLNGDTHHPHMSFTDGKHDGRYVFINDKANTRVARIRCDIMKTDKIVEVPNVQAMHGMRLQKVPETKYVFANAEFRIPHPNDGRFSDDDSKYYTMFNAIDAEKWKWRFRSLSTGTWITRTPTIKASMPPRPAITARKAIPCRKQ